MDTSLIKYHINSWYFLQILTILLDIWDFTFKGWLNKEKYHKTQCWLIFRLILANKQLNDWRRAGHWIYCLFNLFRGEMWTAVERERERERERESERGHCDPLCSIIFFWSYPFMLGLLPHLQPLSYFCFSKRSSIAD